MEPTSTTLTALGSRLSWQIESDQDNSLLIRAPFLSSETAPLLAFTVEGQPILPSVVDPADGGRYRLELPTAAGVILCDLAIQGQGGRFGWSVSMSGKGPRLSLHFPFLQQLTVGPDSRWIDLFTLETAPGIPLLRYRNYQAPLVVTDGSRCLVVLHEGGLVAKDYSPARLSAAPGLPLEPGPEPAIVYRGEIAHVEGGWRPAFALIRDHLRSQLDLSEYQRPDLKWLGEQLVQHFTFLYGREILDLDRGVFDMERLLDEGERDFGGYDGFLVWGGYPRVGLDERTQWDFYDDLPGGRAALRAMAGRARERGARLFVPYLPWDRSHEHHGRTGPSDAEELARLIADVDADGVFLDTLGMITPEFRQTIDRQKPGVAFCSELRTQGKALEIVTSCWEQSYTRDGLQGNWSAASESMPMIDLWRFVLPEHRLFVINRHAMAGDRIRIIQRGFFNGMGWVVWVDIFGLTLPYTPAEAALLKKCRIIFRENLDALSGAAPTPLVETCLPDLFASEFAGNALRMWTLYNQTDQAMAGELMPCRPRPGHHLVDVWHGRAAQVSPQGNLIAEVGSRQVGCVVEYPNLIELSADRTAYRISAPVGDLLCIDDGSREEERTAASAADWTPLARRRGPLRIRLMGGRQVIDQIFLAEEG